MKTMHALITALLILMVGLLAPRGAAAAELVLSPKELNSWREAGREHLLIDVRHDTLFETGHIPGAMNIPGEVLPLKGLPQDKDIVLYDNDLSGKTARAAGVKLGAVNTSRIYLLRGGLRAWEAEGFASTRPAGMFDPTFENTITGEDLREAIRLGMPLQIVDVRDSKSFAKSSVPGATNVPLIKSPKELGDLKSDRLDLVLNLSPKAKSALKSNDMEYQQNGAADLAALDLLDSLKAKNEALKAEGKALPTGAIIVVDNGGALSPKLLPTLKGKADVPVLLLERGIVGWEASSESFETGGKETFFHGSTSFNVTEKMKEMQKSEE